MVVVEREDEAELLDRLLALGAHGDASVLHLPCVDDLVAENAGEDAVHERARGVVREPRGQRERIGTKRLQLDFEHDADHATADGYADRVKMRATWDALASDPDAYVGDPERGRSELQGLFERLGADPRGGTCVEVGCGPGRMTAALAERFDHVIGVDVSPAMVEQARANVPDPRVEFHVVPGDRLTVVFDGSVDAVVCYLVLQHLPTRDAITAYLREFRRVLSEHCEVFVQLPVLDAGVRPRVWRAVRSAVVPLTSLGPTRRREFRGFRLTRGELDDGLSRASLRVVASDVGPDAPYRFSHDLFLRLTR